MIEYVRRFGSRVAAVVHAGGDDAWVVGNAGGGGHPDPGPAGAVWLHQHRLLVVRRRVPRVLRGPMDALRLADGASGVGREPAVCRLPQAQLR